MKKLILLVFILTFFSCKRKEEVKSIQHYVYNDTIKEKELWKIIQINRRLRYYDNIIIENQHGETKHIRERNASLRFKVGDIYEF